MSAYGTLQTVTEYILQVLTDCFNPDNRHSHNQGRTSGVDPQATLEIIDQSDNTATKELLLSPVSGL